MAKQTGGGRSKQNGGKRRDANAKLENAPSKTNDPCKPSGPGRGNKEPQRRDSSRRK